MKTTEVRGRHLTPDEIVARVFPVDEETAPVPLHLAVCAECQSKVAHLREGWLLDRGAVAGVVDALPAGFWEGQTASIMQTLQSTGNVSTGVRPFPVFIRSTSFLRRPVVAFGSLAAALVLMAGISFLKPKAPPIVEAQNQAVPTKVAVTDVDRTDDELLRDIDRALEEAPFSSLVPEGVS